MIGTNNSRTDDADSIAAGVELIVKNPHPMSGDESALAGGVSRNKPTDTPEQLATLRAVNQQIAKLDNGRTVRFLNINARFVGADGKAPADIMPDFRI